VPENIQEEDSDRLIDIDAVVAGVGARESWKFFLGTIDEVTAIADS
jgi:hypothetical protein